MHPVGTGALLLEGPRACPASRPRQSRATAGAEDEGPDAATKAEEGVSAEDGGPVSSRGSGCSRRCEWTRGDNQANLDAVRQRRRTRAAEEAARAAAIRAEEEELDDELMRLEMATDAFQQLWLATAA